MSTAPAPIDNLLARARTEAEDRLARRGGLTPFALTDDGQVLDGQGATNRDQLDDLYARLAELASGHGAPACAVVVSEGSSDDYPNLLIQFAETANGQASRTIEAIDFLRRPLFFGPILLRKGVLRLAVLEANKMPCRIWTTAKS
jgi:hypothetical protein